MGNTALYKAYEHTRMDIHAPAMDASAFTVFMADYGPDENVEWIQIVEDSVQQHAFVKSQKFLVPWMRGVLLLDK
jgi:hypothetical protein